MRPSYCKCQVLLVFPGFRLFRVFFVLFPSLLVSSPSIPLHFALFVVFFLTCAGTGRQPGEATELVVQVFDWDLASSDDFLGQVCPHLISLPTHSIADTLTPVFRCFSIYLS